MSATALQVLGTVRADGTLELDSKLQVPPGRVKVLVESLEPIVKPAEGLVEFVQRRRRENGSGGASLSDEGGD
jgi:hypothetical protein